jgi:hypothetical protein
MAILVFRIFSIVDGTLIPESDLPRQSRFRRGDVAVVLTNLSPCGDACGPAAWNLPIEIRQKKNVRNIDMPLPPFLTAQQYKGSLSEPLCFAQIAPSREPPPNWLWLYRDVFYVTERSPRPSEMQEVVLRIKSLHFQRDEKLKRLKEQVANFEAIERNLKNSSNRRTIPDDVKLLVWSRDGGVCVKCGASKDLHFDHIIPHARGGSDGAENIQLLCRTCNLAKSDRLA